MLFFLLPALLPLLRGTALPCTHDNALHYYRITAIDAAWRQGWIFSRWVPNLALGYGYPFFNFREPLPYLIGALLYQTGLGLPLVLGLLYAGSFIAAAWGAYVLGRDLFGEWAGWVAALAYGLGPYLLLDALRRGNMPESVALALLPWLLVTFRRIILGQGRGPFVAAVLLLAALFLSHNITSLLFAPFLGGYVILLAWLYRGHKSWPWAFAAAFLAVMLTAWFWFPALTEQATVQLHLSRTTRNNDYHYNFATWQEILLSLPTPADPAFLNAPMRVPLGLLQWGLAIVGLPLAWRRVRDPERRATLIFFALIAIVYLWMSTPGSLWLWETFPVLAFIQFPWRLVGRALLPVSLLAAAAFVSPSSGAHSVPATRCAESTRGSAPYIVRFTFYTSLLLCVFCSWPDTYPPKGFCVMESHPDMADLYAYEQQGWLGVDPEGSYFPIWVEDHPTDTRLAQAFMRGAEPERLDTAVLPDGAQVLAATYRPLRASISLETPMTFQARWLGFYFPGWQVEIDGLSVPTAPEEDSGLLTFVVPAGQHRLDVRFGTTPTRKMLGIASTVALLVFGLAIWQIKCRREVPLCLPDDGDSGPPSVACFSPRDAFALGLLAIALFGLKLLVVDRTTNPLRHSRLVGGTLPEVERPLRQPFSGGLTLLGYDQAATVLPADAELQVDLLWQAQAAPAVEYYAVVLLIGADGQLWSHAGTLRPRGYEPPLPTTRWLPGQYAYDPHIVQPLAGTPPGEYTLVVSLFDKATLAPASVLNADGNPGAPHLSIGTVRIMPPSTPPTLSSLAVPVTAALQRCGTLGLWTMSADRSQAAPGEVVGLRWVWEALETPRVDLTALLTLADASGNIARTWELPLAAGWWPTERWSAGERWLGRPIIRLPGGLESGAYSLAVRLPDCEAVLAQVPLDMLAPRRVWQVPSDLRPADVLFGGEVRLVGYALDPPLPVAGQTLSVRLAWQAVAEMHSAYRVFVHLIGEAGRVLAQGDLIKTMLAQSDGEPVNWTRPTTGWAVNEVVLETREISIPAELTTDEAVLRVGLYMPDGPRLVTDEGEDAFVLGYLHFK